MGTKNSKNHKNGKKSKDCCYDGDQVGDVQKAYLIGIVAWIVLVSLLRILPTHNLIEFLILLVPVLVFLISWKSAPFISEDVEENLFRANLLTLGLLIALPILTWVYKKSKQNRPLFIKLLIVAIILSVLTLIGVGVPHKKLPLLRHIRSMIQTMALTIFIFALYRYYLERRNRDLAKLSLNKGENKGDQLEEKLNTGQIFFQDNSV